MKRLLLTILLALAVVVYAQQPITHIAQKGETLYGIAKQYGKTVEDLKELNPKIKNKPRKGQVVIIGIEQPVTADTVEVIEQPEVFLPPAPPVHHIVAMLPLMLTAETDLPKGAMLMTDFVKGMLLAANDMRQPGADTVTITVLDTHGSPSRARALMDTAACLQQPCVIIAPEDGASLLAISQKASAKGQKVFNIFNTREETALAQPSMLQANITHDDMYRKAINYMLETWPRATLVTLESANSRNDKLEFVQAAREAFRQAGRPPVDIAFDRRLEEQDLAVLDPMGEYLFLPLSGSLSEFNKIYGGLKIFKEDTAILPDNVQVFGYPDWSAFRGEALRNLDNLNTTIYTRFYDDATDANNGAVAQKFKQQYGSDMIDAVPKQGLLGYDVATWLIGALRRGGSLDNLAGERFTGLQSAFDFTPEESDGIEAATTRGVSNQALIIIHFTPDGRILRSVI